jgi:hypothetical protein
LYSGGLCEAVIITPTSAFSILVKNAKTGVGTTSKQVTFAPAASKPETSAFSSIKPETLVSRATSTLLSLELFATARPVLAASAGVSSTLTNPRMPELPKSFDLKLSNF